ncbi:MFS transporter [[Phormidium ambiguum] IAM M-71]|uniref:MFS transporter n=1 Tax=[Phormidium ambiguum] IAM M-71 TaxID=454136 RepID=A0A1U7IRJ2_9CYAN|nr:MFS transporter [Phormidium ambiguum]OKH40015.1 MFS transporter [Phormidium ambiguum IAM M-71]
MLSKLRQVNLSLFAIVAEGFLSRLSFGFISFALPLYATHLGLSLTQIGFLIALNEAVALMLKPLMGWVADRFGLKRSFTIAIGLRSLVALLLAFVTSPWQLYAVRAIHGSSKALRDPSASALIAEQGGKKAIASAFAWYHTAKMVAGSLGKALAGIILTVTAANFSLVFALSFVISIFPLYAVARYVRESHSQPEEATTKAEALAQATPQEPANELPVNVSESRWLLLPFTLLNFLINGTAEMLKGLFPILATQYGGLNEAQTGLIYTASTLVLLVSGPLFGWLSDRGNRKLVLMVRSISNTISSIIYIFVPNFFGIATGKLVDDIGKSAFRPAWGSLMAHISSFDKRRRAQTMSWMILGEDAGTIVGPILAGFLWTTWGLPIMLSVRVGLAIVTEVYAAYLDRLLENQDRGTKSRRRRRRRRSSVLNWFRRKAKRK